MSVTLNPDEINALMDAIQEGRVATETSSSPRATVVPYDLTSRDRIIRGQMPTLDAINEQIASVLASGLGGRIRINLRVVSTPSTLLKFADFTSVLAPPATVCVLSLGKGYGLALAVLEPGLADTLLGAALGDRRARDNSPGEARRELTSVERFVLKRLLGILTEGMAQAWGPVLPLAPEVLRFETDPRMANIAPPSEAAILSTFEFSDGIKGRLQLAIPFTAVESEKKALASPPKVATGVDARFTTALADEIEQVHVEVRALLGRAHIHLSRVLDLEEGDLLTLDTDEDSALELRVEDRVKLTGTPAVRGSNLALVIERDLRLQAEHQPDLRSRERSPSPKNLSPAA